MSRPYFEVKVVKIKKEKKDNYCWQCGIKENPKHCFCPYCGNRLKSKTQPKGNWVNGENLDKIKFPCFCSYENMGEKFLGELNSSYTLGSGQYYILSCLEAQGETSVVERCQSLKNLIKHCNVHILKGKIIIYEDL